MIISTVTDEVTSEIDIEKVISAAVEKGIMHFEIRNVEGKRFPEIDKKAFNKLIKLKEIYGITYTAVSPGIFKDSVLGSEKLNFDKNILLENTMKKSEKLGINRIIIFGIKRGVNDSEADINNVIEELGSIALKAKSRGFEILVENEPERWADTSENCYKLLSSVNLDALKLNWDPGNLYKTGEQDYEPGYKRIRKFIGNVHLKNYITQDGKSVCVPVGEGDIDIKGQIKYLENDGYKGFVTVETHCKPLPECFIKSVEYLKSIL